MNPEVQSRISMLRQKEAEGKLTIDDMREAVRFLRAGRVGAMTASDTAKRKKARAAVVDGQSLLDELNGGLS